MPKLPATTAVLVIDVQRGLFCTDPAPAEAAATIARINRLVARARAAGRPVWWVQHAEAPDLVAGTPAWELHPDLDRRPGEPVIGKTACDSFCGTDLAARLRAHGADTLVLLGYATEFCVDTTVRRAASEGFRVVVAADGHTTKDRPVLAAAAIRAHHNWVWSELSAPQPVRVVPAERIEF